MGLERFQDRPVFGNRKTDCEVGVAVCVKLYEKYNFTIERKKVIW